MQNHDIDLLFIIFRPKVMKLKEHTSLHQIETIKYVIKSMIESIEQLDQQKFNQLLESNILQRAVNDGYSPINIAINYIFSNHHKSQRFRNEQDAIVSQQYLFIQLYAIEGLSWYIRSDEYQFASSDKAIQLLSGIGANHYEECLKLMLSETESHKTLAKNIFAKLPSLQLYTIPKTTLDFNFWQNAQNQSQIQHLSEQNKELGERLAKSQQSNAELNSLLQNHQLYNKELEKELENNLANIQRLDNHNLELESELKKRQQKLEKLQQVANKKMISQTTWTENQYIENATQTDGSSQNLEPETPIRSSAKERSDKEPRKISKISEILTDDNHYLVTAIKEGDIIKVKNLIERSYNIYSLTIDGNSMLHESSIAGRLDMVKFISRYGMRAGYKNKNNKTPSQLSNNAEIKGYLESLECFEKNLMHDFSSVSSELQDLIYISQFIARSSMTKSKMAKMLQMFLSEGATSVTILQILCCAVITRNIPFIQTIHEIGYDINCQNLDGTTVLHFMASREFDPKNDPIVIKALFEMGANYNIKNKKNQTANDVAITMRNGQFFIYECNKYSSYQIKKEAYEFSKIIPPLTQLGLILNNGAQQQFIYHYLAYKKSLDSKEEETLLRQALDQLKIESFLVMLPWNIREQYKNPGISIDQTRNNQISGPKTGDIGKINFTIRSGFNRDKIRKFLSGITKLDKKSKYLLLNKIIFPTDSQINDAEGRSLFNLAVLNQDQETIESLLDLGTPIDYRIYDTISQKRFNISKDLILFLLKEFDGNFGYEGAKRLIMERILSGDANPNFLFALEEFYDIEKVKEIKYKTDLDIKTFISLEQVDLCCEVFNMQNPIQQGLSLCKIMDYGRIDLFAKCISNKDVPIKFSEDKNLANVLFNLLVNYKENYLSDFGCIFIDDLTIEMKVMEQCFEMLLRRPNQITTDKNNSLHSYIQIQSKFKNLSFFKMVLDSINCPSILNARIEDKTPFYEAVINGNLEIVQLMALRDDIDILAKDEEDETALHAAVANGFVDIAAEILKKDIPIDILDSVITYSQELTDENELTRNALRLVRKKIELIELSDFERLIKEGKIDKAKEKIDEREYKFHNSYFRNCAYIAATKNQKELLIKLLDKGVPTNFYNKDDISLINTVISLNKCEIAEILCQRNISLQGYANHEPPLHIAVRLKRVDIIKTILRHYQKNPSYNLGNITFNGENITTFTNRLIKENQEDKESLEKYNKILELLINAQESFLPEYSGNKSLKYKPEEVKQQIQQKINQPGLSDHEKQQYIDTVFVEALKNGNEDIMVAALNHKANPNLIHEGLTPLMYASIGRKVETVEFLLKIDGIKIDQEDEFGLTALTISCMENITSIASRLINKGSRVDHEDYKGNTALLYCCSQSNKDEAIKLLLQNNSNVNHQNHQGLTALHKACEKGLTSVVTTLIDYGASINIKSTNGLNALDIACESGNEFILNIILNSGQDISKQEYAHAIEIAQEKRHENCISIIQQNLKNLDQQEIPGGSISLGLNRAFIQRIIEIEGQRRSSTL